MVLEPKDLGFFSSPPLCMPPWGGGGTISSLGAVTLNWAPYFCSSWSRPIHMLPHLSLLQMHQTIVADPRRCHRGHFLRHHSGPNRLPAFGFLNLAAYYASMSLFTATRIQVEASSTLDTTDLTIGSPAAEDQVQSLNTTDRPMQQVWASWSFATLHTNFCDQAVLHLILLCAL
jgi:hypothetical protein